MKNGGYVLYTVHLLLQKKVWKNQASIKFEPLISVIQRRKKASTQGGALGVYALSFPYRINRELFLYLYFLQKKLSRNQT